MPAVRVGAASKGQEATLLRQLTGAGLCSRIPSLPQLVGVQEAGLGFAHFPASCFFQASQVVLVVKNLPANAGDIRDLGWEDPLEEGLAIHFRILAWRIPWTAEPGGQGP